MSIIKNLYKTFANTLYWFRVMIYNSLSLGPSTTEYCYLDGTRYWMIGVKFHREDGPAIISSNGDEVWYFLGEVHRGSGPAATSADGMLEWYKYGVRHRADGPAIIHPDGYEEWWIDGTSISKQEFEAVSAKK